MNRRLLAAAVATAPLLLVIAGQAYATTEISTSTTTPVATATANGGAPDNVDIAAGGSINPTAPGIALLLNSNNSVTSEGSITFTNLDNVVAIEGQGGVTGSILNQGSISITEPYVAPINPNTGVAYGDWASGGNRTGIAVVGGGIFNGSVTNTGAMTIVGNNSYGILLDTQISGSLSSLVVTPATSSTVASVANGSISVTGNGVAGIYVTANGGVGGNMTVTSITAQGIGAQGVVVDGNVGGTMNISSTVSATGYRSDTRPSTPILSTQYTPDQLEQGGSAVNIGANLGSGLIISAPPFPQSTTNLDLDNNGVPDALQGTGLVESFGSAPALQIGSLTRSISLGEVGTGSNGYGLVIQGSVLANGVYDPLLAPALPGVVSATAIDIYGTTPNSTILYGGMHNTGTVSATAYQADATAIHLGAGATVPAIVNDGSISAFSQQVNSATTPTPVTIGTGTSTITIPAPLPVAVTGILIDQGADVSSISNSKTISATLSGAGGVGGTTVAAILDNSGTVDTVNNTGNITATLNQTYVATPITAQAVIGIDISHGNGSAPQSITQGFAPAIISNNLTTAAAQAAAAYVSTNAYAVGAVVTENGQAYQCVTAAAAGEDPVSTPTFWLALGALNPSITGNILFGNGGSTLTVTGGTVTATTIDLGTGVNTVTVNGLAPTLLNGVAQNGTVVTGAIKEGSTNGSGSLTINVESGTLSDTNPNVMYANSVNVGANGTLLVAADPVNETSTHIAHTMFITNGVSNFASGAQLGLSLLSVQQAQSEVYTVVQAAGGGTLTAGTFGPNAIINNAPYLYTATPSYVASDPQTGDSEIQLTVTRRTPAQLGFNAAEGSALNAVLAAIPNDANIQAAVLAQTTQAGLKSVYDQLLPDQGQGIFDALDAAAQAISTMTGTTPDAGVRVPGTSLWLQEVNTRIERSGTDSVGSYTQMLGLVAGYEHEGPAGGAIGLTLSYLNAAETDSDAAVGAHVVGSMVEGGGYYRRAAGPLTMSLRGAAGYAWFADDRRFVTVGAVNNANSNWGAYFVDAHAGAGYEMHLGRFYARPETSVDYLRLDEGAHADSGGGNGFDLAVDSRTSTRFSGSAVMVLGTQWGRTSWLRAELSGGYREVFSGEVGDTTANFTNGNPFVLAADPDKGGWATVGFSLKSGSPYAYVALEGEADLRAGEQRYDLMVAGRSLF